MKLNHDMFGFKLLLITNSKQNALELFLEHQMSFLDNLRISKRIIFNAKNLGPRKNAPTRYKYGDDEITSDYHTV